MHKRSAILFLNVAHAVDHMFLLIFATAVAAIAADFGFARWEDLMPYGVGAFVLFGLGSLPSGRLGDLWGRRRMMLVFFFGIGVAALLAAATRNAWQLAAALTLLGAFASIYHPVGIPMLLQHARNPGAVIGVNGLAGNLGIAVAALSTGFMVQWLGWRAAFALPGLLAIACGLLFAWICPQEAEPPARRSNRASVALSPAALARVFAVMTAASVTGGLLFNFTTNGNGQLMRERFQGIIEDPARLGMLLQQAPLRAVQVLSPGQHAQAREHLIDDRGLLRAACRAENQRWALVRPDAYLAANGAGLDGNLIRGIEKALALA